MTFVHAGHYVVLTLFLAVIFDAFESSYDGQAEDERIVADVVTHAVLREQAQSEAALAPAASSRV
jgi:hypothetical protein